MQNTFESFSEKEFLLTNGNGGYCSSTKSGANTRRYHGLLVASFNPPTERLVLVSKVEERIVTEHSVIELSSNLYPDLVHPKGYAFIETVQSTTETASWTFNMDNVRLKKTIEMVAGENTVVITYQNLSQNSLLLQLEPLLVYKDYHALFRESPEYDFFHTEIQSNCFQVYACYGAHPLYMSASSGTWSATGWWYKNFQYQREKERGFDFEEDAYSIQQLTVSLKADSSVALIFSTKELHGKIASVEKDSTRENDFLADLLKSSRQFVVHRNSTNEKTLLAGYPWFTDWGRDTMIAIRGICIATGMQEEAKSILKTFLKFIDQGLLPNRFPDYKDDTVEYNTIDASLWLFVAIHDYYMQFSDKALIEEALGSLQQMIEWHVKGTQYGIHVNDQGLLCGGEPGYQLTWMDAKVDGEVVTPRMGCPVEVNLLWYNALTIYQMLLLEVNRPRDLNIDTMIAAFEASFLTSFWNEAGFLNDVVVPGQYSDSSIRPNQIYALSLPFSPLGTMHQKYVLDTVERHLLTPYGLRTLEPHHPAFKPVYEGNAWQRDHSYHQGTVWPFLWGEWALAYLKLHEFSQASCDCVWKHSLDLQEHFYHDGCSHAIAEIFDGLEPTTGKGCVQQAWSVGNLLMVFLHPKFNSFIKTVGLSK